MFLLTLFPLTVENVYLTGNVEELTDWSTTTGLPMSSANYPIWSSASLILYAIKVPFSDTISIYSLVSVVLPPETDIQYKYTIIDGSTVTWETGANREFTTPANGTLVENDVFRT